MKMKEQAPTLSAHDYEYWRLTGIAFESRESEYAATNVTLASCQGGSEGSTRSMTCAYEGDIVNGPYTIFGIHTELEGLLEPKAGRPAVTAGEVALHNTVAMVQEQDTHVQRCVGACAATMSTAPSRVCARLVSPDHMNDLHARKRHSRRYALVCYSNSLVHLFAREGVAELFADRCLIIVESAQ